MGKILPAPRKVVYLDMVSDRIFLWSEEYDLLEYEQEWFGGFNQVDINVLLRHGKIFRVGMW